MLTGSNVSESIKQTVKKAENYVDKVARVLEVAQQGLPSLEQRLKQKRQSLLKQGMAMDRENLFWKKEWTWVDSNAETNHELFLRILE